jgi:hypothetical protein
VDLGFLANTVRIAPGVSQNLLRLTLDASCAISSHDQADDVPDSEARYRGPD